MARTFQTHLRVCILRLSLSVLSSLGFAVAIQAQTATYRLHREASTTTNLFQLKTANPDAAILAVQSANLKNVATGEYIIKAFDTQANVPNASGVIVAGSSVTFTLWMAKTATAGTMLPRVKLNLNSPTGSSICVVTGATALTTTLTKYTLNGTVPANVTMSASDRFYLWVGVNLTATSSVNNRGELDIEGTLNGNYDSLITVPLPTPPPSISNLSPTAALVGTAVTINGANFGATQGTSTVTLNGLTASPGNWTDTNIAVAVPAGATTGPVVVTARGSASNGVTFTVLTAGTIAGTITRTSDGAALSGALVEALQAGVVKGSATTVANGSYTMSSVITGTYDVRVSAIGYQTKVQNGVTVTTNNTTTVNQSLDAVVLGDINYIYDESGRLVSVVSATETATYTYDSAGNLLTILRQNSNLPSITEFTPNNGAISAPVTIYGTAFSSTAGQNTVKFNGVAATVVSATPTQIVTAVPAGASTGTISVNTPFGLATSSAPFTVSASTAPTITSFSPAIGTPGTGLTITGTSFETTVSNDGVTLNNRYALVNSATSTSISTNVPSLGTSGRISVATPAGKATSAVDFFVPPSPYAAADVGVTGRMVFGESKAVTISAANKIGLILFDGIALQRASLEVNSFSLTSSRVAIYNPDGTALASTTFLTNGGLLDTPLLPATGTYTILIDPDGTNTGSVNFTLYNASDVTGTITPGGSPVTVITTIHGQNARLTFSGTAGQRVSLQLSNSTFSGCIAVNDSIKNPDGTTLTSINLCSASEFLDTVTLPVTGTFTVLVDPPGTITGSQTLLLNDVPPDVTGSITPGGSSVIITTTTPGQNARLTFSGTAGQRVSLQLSNSTFSGCIAVNDSIKNPDGTTLTSINLCSASEFLDTVTLPVTGTFTVLVDPPGTITGSQTLLLNDVPPDVTGSITPGGSSVIITTTTPGQNARLTFSGTAGQRVSLELSNSTFSGCIAVNDSIKKPDGTTLTYVDLCSASGFLEPITLPVTGSYSILIDPIGATVGSQTLSLYDVPADASNDTTIGSPAVGVTTTAPGQNAEVTFTGTSSQQVTVHLTGNTMGTMYLRLLNPDGTVLFSNYYNAVSFDLPAQTLPASGTYKVSFDPLGTSTGSINVTVTNP